MISSIARRLAALERGRDTDASRAKLPFSAILSCLGEHRVDYVLIGGLAAIFHGHLAFTDDVDIAPNAERANVDRLSRAITELVALARPKLAALPLQNDRALEWNVPRDLGLDLMFHPDGTTGYADLSARAVRCQFHSWEIKVADLNDVITSKKATGRPKDVATVPALVALLACQP